MGKKRKQTDGTEREVATLLAALGDTYGDAAGAIRDDLTRLRRIIGDANNQLQNSFEGLNSQAKSQESLIRELAGDMNGASDHRLSDSIGDLLDTIVGRAQSHAAMLGRFKDVSGQRGQIVGILHKLDTIAGQTKFLALNAMIEARRAGEAGKTFRVVADEVKTLSRDSTAFSQEIRTVVHSSKEEIDEARDRVQTMSEQDTSLVSDSRTQVERMVGGMEALNAKLAATLDQVSGIATQVERRVADAVRSLQFEDIVSQIIDHAMLELSRVEEVGAQLLQATAPGADDGQPALQSQQLRSLTLQLSEMSAGFRRTATQDSIAEGDVELF